VLFTLWQVSSARARYDETLWLRSQIVVEELHQMSASLVAAPVRAIAGVLGQAPTNDQIKIVQEMTSGPNAVRIMSNILEDLDAAVAHAGDAFYGDRLGARHQIELTVVQYFRMKNKTLYDLTERSLGARGMWVNETQALGPVIRFVKDALGAPIVTALASVSTTMAAKVSVGARRVGRSLEYFRRSEVPNPNLTSRAELSDLGGFNEHAREQDPELPKSVRRTDSEIASARLAFKAVHFRDAKSDDEALQFLLDG